MGYSSIYETELGLIFDNGHLTEIKKYDNSKSVRSEYEKDDDKRKDFIYSNIDWNKLPQDDKKDVKVFASVTVDSIGNIDSVLIRRSTDDRYNDEISRVLKQIPQWSVFYRHGQFLPINWSIQVFIDKKIRRKYGS